MNPNTAPAEIKANLLKQLIPPVRWTQSVKNMLADGMTDFVECGPGTVLTKLIERIMKGVIVLESIAVYESDFQNI